MSVKKKRRITVAPVDEPPTPLLMSRLRFGEEASTRYVRHRARLWPVRGHDDAWLECERGINGSISLSALLQKLCGMGYYYSGVFDNFAWGDVICQREYPQSYHDTRRPTLWVVAGDHRHKEEWTLIKCHTHFPLQLYDAPEGYWSHLHQRYQAPTKYRLDLTRIYGHPMQQGLERHLGEARLAHVALPVLVEIEGGYVSPSQTPTECFIVLDYMTQNDNRPSHAEFVKLYNQRMERVEADMKVILWVSLRYIHVEEQCFPWDVCLEIISFLAAPRKELLTEIESV